MPPSEGYYIGQEIKKKKASGEIPERRLDENGNGMYVPYAFDPTMAFSNEEDWLQRYSDSIPGSPEPAPDLTRDLRNAGTYKGFDWAKAGDELMGGYQPPEYVAADYIAAPTYQKTQYSGTSPYQKTNFDFSDKYQPPDEYQAFGFTQPDVADVQKVQPLADSVWNAKKQDAFDAVDTRYNDIAQRTRDELIRTGKRPEQAAAVMQNLDIEREKAKREESRKLDIAQADQTVGISQKEQELGLQRGLAVAGMDTQTQENMAAELSKKYGYSLDDARYVVDQYAKQQEAQAGENKSAYDASAAEDRYKFEAEKGENQYANEAETKEATRQYDASVNEAKYGYEAGTEAERYDTGMDQWFKEQQAAEAEKEWQSKYGAAQDIAQAKQTQWQDEQAAKTDQWNAIMQGAQQAGTSAAQQGTYWTNLEPGERKDKQTAAQNYSGFYKPQQNVYGGGNQPTTVKPTFKTSTQPQQPKQQPTLSFSYKPNPVVSTTSSQPKPPDSAKPKVAAAPKPQLKY